MIKTILEKIKVYKRSKYFKNKSKNWDFKNIDEFLEYTTFMNEKLLVSHYKNQMDKLGVSDFQLNRTIKENKSSKMVNLKHLNIIIKVMDELNNDKEDFSSRENLYNKIKEYFIKICKEKYGELKYTDLFFEMYQLNLETSVKIYGLIDKYLSSVKNICM